MAAIQVDIGAQRTLLTELAEQVLQGAAEVDVEGLRADLTKLREQQDLQASALMEGLMDLRQQRTEIQQQRSALVALAGRCDTLGFPPPCAAVDGEGRAAAAGGDGLGDLAGFPREALLKVVTEQVQALVKTSTQELGRLVEEHAAAQRRELAGLFRDLAEASLPTPLPTPTPTQEAAQGAPNSEGLADELASIARKAEHQCLELTKALEMERTARVNEAAEIRSLVARQGHSQQAASQPAAMEDALREAIEQAESRLERGQADALRRAEALGSELRGHVGELASRQEAVAQELAQLGAHHEAVRVALSGQVEQLAARQEAERAELRVQVEHLAARQEAVRMALIGQVEQLAARQEELRAEVQGQVEQLAAQQEAIRAEDSEHAERSAASQEAEGAELRTQVEHLAAQQEALHVDVRKWEEHVAAHQALAEEVRIQVQRLAAQQEGLGLEVRTQLEQLAAQQEGLGLEVRTQLEQLAARQEGLGMEVHEQLGQLAVQQEASVTRLAKDVERIAHNAAASAEEVRGLAAQVAAVEARSAELCLEMGACRQLGDEFAEASQRLARLEEQVAQHQRAGSDGSGGGDAAAAAERVERELALLAWRAELLERRMVESGVRVDAAALAEPIPEAAAARDAAAQPSRGRGVEPQQRPTLLGSRTSSASLPAERLCASSPGADRGAAAPPLALPAVSPLKSDPGRATVPTPKTAVPPGKTPSPPPAPRGRRKQGGGARGAGAVHSVPAALHGLVEPVPPATPRRRALVAGCSYSRSHAPLLGPLNDAWNVLSLLRHTMQYREDQVCFLLDGGEHLAPAVGRPTKANLMDGLRWLVAGAQAEDELLLYFSGYGTQLPSWAGGDLYEAFLVPADFAEDLPQERLADLSGGSAVHMAQARGSAAYRLLPLADLSVALAGLPLGCKVTIVLDCCHALVPGVGASGHVAPVTFPQVAMEMPGGIGGPPSSPGGAFAPRHRYLELPPLPAAPGQPRQAAARPVPEVSCAALCLAACRPQQCCVELPIEGAVQGAFTWAWVKALLAGHLEPTVQQLVTALGTILLDLQQHFQWMDQTPVVQLSAAAQIREVQRCVAGPRPQASMLRAPMPEEPQRRKALLVGVNYWGSHAPLKGCVNDVWNFHCVLRHALHFSEDQVRLLMDGENGQPAKASRAPTRANITAGLEWLAEGAQQGDSLLLVFCGYGAQHVLSPAGEAQAYLVPSDFAVDLEALAEPTAPGQEARLPMSEPGSAGYRLVSLLELNRLAVRLPAGVSLTMVLDCAYAVVPGLSPAQNLPVTFPKVSRGRLDHGQLQEAMSRPRFLELPSLPLAHPPQQQLGLAPSFPECAVHCFSACRLPEWAAELPLEGTVQGGFSWAFTKALAARGFRGPVGALQRHLSQTAAELRGSFRGVEQTPVLMLSQAASLEDPVFSAR